MTAWTFQAAVLLQQAAPAVLPAGVRLQRHRRAMRSAGPDPVVWKRPQKACQAPKETDRGGPRTLSSKIVERTSPHSHERHISDGMPSTQHCIPLLSTNTNSLQAFFLI